MKKGIIASLALIIVIIGLVNIDWQRLGKDHVYVQVGEATEVEETTLDSGDVVRRYVYSTDALTKDGDAQAVTFTAAKELRSGAYLKLYVKNGDEVTSYDEVSVADIPEAAREKL
ncbi:YxeA family protein [Exiguobacterium aurantiacum]|uniref:YxeA family protein n=1 Tax=Exiguobacterium aurantiacum TaxID=33987 RepID=A0ABY5FR52_9BACL|nr:YxeA family protein [Exiguobacterium aurantiacum]UTT43593.1 YxeA family protein [Exiguobacterium aurantiacum]